MKKFNIILMLLLISVDAVTKNLIYIKVHRI